jgi:hypothetical protein
LDRQRQRRDLSGVDFDERLGFDNRQLVGEGVESGQEESAGVGLDGDEPEWSQGEAVVRLEIVEKSTFATVGEDFVVDVVKNLRAKAFELEGGLIADAVGTGQVAGVFAAKGIGEEPTFSGQFSSGLGSLGKVNVTVFPADDVTGTGNADGQFVAVALDAPGSENVEQFRMEGSSVKVENEVSNRRSLKLQRHGKHVGKAIRGRPSSPETGADYNEALQGNNAI